MSMPRKRSLLIAGTLAPAIVIGGIAPATGIAFAATSAAAVQAAPSASVSPTTAATEPAPDPTPTPTDPTPEPTPTRPPIQTGPNGSLVIGKTRKGRKMVAVRQGNPNGSRVMLVIGEIHGNEKKGRDIVAQLRGRNLSTTGATQLWTITSMNPDGDAATRRYNSRGVDLNRNFPTNWSRRTAGAGRGPASERETKAVMRFLKRLRPDGAYVMHQDWNMVLGYCNWKTRPYAYRFAKLTGLGLERCNRAYTGTMGSWFNSKLPGWMLTVELPSSRRITRSKTTRYTNAVLTHLRQLQNLDRRGPALQNIKRLPRR